MFTKKQYIENLISKPVNYTCTHLADHVDGMRHDAINDHLRRGKVTARALRLAEGLIENQPEAYFIVDDSVQKKPHVRIIELVKRQYSGNTHGVVKGIGVVNLVRSVDLDFYPIEFRLHAPSADRLTKNEHFRDLLRRAYQAKGIEADTILFDSWCGSAENLKFVHRLNTIFVTMVNENRLVSLQPGDGYFHLQQLEWSPQQLRFGRTVKLKEVPFNMQLFKMVAPNGDIDWMITNRSPGSIDTEVVQQENKWRLRSEQLYRELKQLTGIKKCQCRKQRAQRTHIACCHQAWFSLKVVSKKLKTTLYQVRNSLWSEYLRLQLSQPRISAYHPT
ncbi:MAG: transposase [Candidatus Competibacteraceae bacterium]|nr:transposase [Candidatus Competibacteraceae bacterium]